MPFFLAQPFLLFGLAVLVPIALHLLHRRRPRPRSFAAVRFLRQALKANRRSRRLVQGGLLLLRIAVILLLALAFARPMVKFGNLLPGGGRTVMLVLDTSPSMQVVEQDVSRFEQARAWALDILAGLQDGDRLAILAPGSESPLLLYPPVSSLPEARQILGELSPGWRTAQAQEFTLGLLKQDCPGGLEVHIFSDFQENDFSQAATKDLGDLLRQGRGRLFLNSVASHPISNAGFQSVQFLPPAILGDSSFSAHPSIVATGGFAGGDNLHLFFGEAEQASQMLEFADGQTAKPTIVCPVPPGSEDVSGRLELGQDSYAPDNRFFFSLPRVAGLRAMLVDGNGGNSTFFLDKALRPNGQLATLFRPEPHSWEELLTTDLAGFSLLLLCDPLEIGSGLADRLNQYVQDGGTLLLFPGRNGNLNQKTLDLFPALRGLTVTAREFPEEKTRRLTTYRQDEDMSRRLTAMLPPPWPIPVRKCLELNASDSRQQTWHYEDGGLFAFRAEHGQGQICLLSLTADRDWSDWPVTPHYLVFLHELLRQIAGHKTLSLQLEVGDTLACQPADASLQANFSVTSPEGKLSSLTLERPSPSQPFRLDCFKAPGLYQVDCPPFRHHVAVNPPASEAVLSCLRPEDLARIPLPDSISCPQNRDDLQKLLTAFRDGRPLWPTLILLAFLLSVTELLLANLKSRGRRPGNKF